MREDMVLADFTLDDLPAILGLERLAFGADAFTRGYFLQLHRVPGRHFLVARHGSILAAYAIATQARFTGYLVSLAVGEAYRREGVASVLVNELKKRLMANHARHFALHVRAENVPAIALYVRLGFVIEKTVPNYYGSQQPAYYMIAPLTA